MGIIEIGLINDLQIIGANWQKEEATYIKNLKYGWLRAKFA